MTQDLRRELRLFGLVAVILAAYGAIVTSYAAANDQLGLFAGMAVRSAILYVWGIAFGFVFIAYLLDLVLRRRPARPLLVMAQELRAGASRYDLLLGRATVALGFFSLMIFFTPFKVMIGHTRGFPYDAALRDLDRLVFAGHDPWELTHALFGSAPATAVLHTAYTMWFAMVWLGLIYMVLRPQLVQLRSQYLVAFVLTWIIVGSFAAWFLASAGPCYYERAFGDPHFRPLMDRLHVLDAEMKAFAPGFGIEALRVQDLLWQSFARQRELFGGGISAMPSMHVAMSVLMACGGWRLGRTTGWLLTIFAVLIWIGSVHLGWHYALDGVVAFGLALAIWKASGWLVARFVLRETPAAAWRPALAE
jgi:hypothetical protein